MKYITTVNNKRFEIDIDSDGNIVLDGDPRLVDFRAMEGNSVFSLIIDNISYEAVVEERDGKYHVLIRGDQYEVMVQDERALRLAEAAGGGLMGASSGEVVIRSPMPGGIVAVPVKEGQDVKKGQTVVVLESMKMENELKAPRDGTIAHVHVAPGDSVEQNKALITIH